MNRLVFSIILTALLAACGSDTSRHPATGCDMATHRLEAVISNNKITSFAEDAQGHIWIGTDRGLNRYNINEYHQYFSDSSEVSLCHNVVQHVYRDSRNNLWAGTMDGVNLYTDQDVFRRIPVKEFSQNAIQFFEDNQGRLFLNMNVHLCRYDPDSCCFVSLIHDFDPYRQFSSRCYVDRRNRIWVVNPSLIRAYDAATMQRLDSIPVQRYYSASTLADDGRLWLAAGGEIDVFDTDQGRFVDTPAPLATNPRLKNSYISYLHPYEGKIIGACGRHLFMFGKNGDSPVFDDELSFPFKAPGFNVSTIYTDSEGNLWFGSTDQGYRTVYRHHDRFSNFLSAYFKNKSITSMTRSGETLILHTLDNEIYTWRQNSSEPPERATILPPKTNVISVHTDNDGYIWILTNNRAYKTRQDRGHLVPVADYEVFLPVSLEHDAAGTIWISSYTNMIYALRKGATEFTPIQIRPKTFTFTPDLLTLADGRVMAVTFDYPLQFIDPGNWSIVASKISYGNVSIPALASKFTPTTLFQDSRGQVWIGTVGNGLLRYDVEADSLSRVENISCNDICAILEDNYGNIWISTKYGLNKYDYTTDSVSHFYITDGIGGNQFYPCSALKSADGTLMFGGTHGITAFNPSEITGRRNVRLCFENLKIHNELVTPYNSSSIDRIMPLNPDITLTSDQNSFSISFTALEYGEYERPHYMYMLEGMDPHWIDAGNNREVFYSNLPPGKYRFRVKATDPDKNTVEAENSLNIVVKPSAFFSWWAKLLYFIVFVAIGFLFYHIWSRIKKEREHARFAEQEKLQEKKVNEMNMSFFANISHEFRTPLTLIAGPVAELAGNSGLSDNERKLMDVVRRNVTRMQRLVNQILDFHKLENDTLRLQVEDSDIIAILKSVTETFVYNARQKNISLVCYGLEDSFRMPVDSDKLEKIAYNLLSNAMKFTPAGGRIEIAFDTITNSEAMALVPDLGENATGRAPDFVKITVSDTGPGFPEKQLHKVFDRYYQCEGDGRYNWGTGIGLYYARRLARIHHGALVAANRTDGSGAVLTLLLPVDAALFAENERTSDPGHVIVDSATDSSGDTGAVDSSRKSILVVDDDIEIAHYLKSLLDRKYNVVCRHDAASALSVLPEFNPDLVISDVVMPGGSGFELCRDIKDNAQFSHIPVILLTAKSTVNEQVEGLDSGADAYITKPFEPSYLMAMVKTTLQNRARLREMLTSGTEVTAASDNELSPYDKKFMDEIYALMESELNNSELDLAKVLDVLKISRTKLYYKLKGLTGQTPASFFKIYKLNRAAELIREGKYNISEIADMTGFSTLPHFSSSFKKQFGVSPSDFV